MDETRITLKDHGDVRVCSPIGKRSNVIKMSLISPCAGFWFGYAFSGGVWGGFERHRESWGLGSTGKGLGVSD